MDLSFLSSRLPQALLLSPLLLGIRGQSSLPISHFVDNSTFWRSQHSHQPPSKLKDYACNTVLSGIPPLICTSSPQSSDSGMYSYPISHYVYNDKFSAGYKEFLAVVTVDVQPSHISKVVPHLPWQEAM